MIDLPAVMFGIGAAPINALPPPSSRRILAHEKISRMITVSYSYRIANRLVGRRSRADLRITSAVKSTSLSARKNFAHNYS